MHSQFCWTHIYKTFIKSLLVLGRIPNGFHSLIVISRILKFMNCGVFFYKKHVKNTTGFLISHLSKGGYQDKYIAF